MLARLGLDINLDRSIEQEIFYACDDDVIWQNGAQGRIDSMTLLW